MATRYIIDINHNDDLQTVIKKCNRNFKVIVGQQSKLDQIEANDASDAVSNIVSGAVGEAVESINEVIEAETEARRQGDRDTQNAISTLQQSLADVAFSGDYNDLINTPLSISVSQDPQTNVLTIVNS